MGRIDGRFRQSCLSGSHFMLFRHFMYHVGRSIDDGIAFFLVASLAWKGITILGRNDLLIKGCWSIPCFF